MKESWSNSPRNKSSDTLGPIKMSGFKEYCKFLWENGASGKFMLSLAIFAIMSFPCLIGYAIYSEFLDVNPNIQVSNGVEYRIDTLSIHGVKHEFIVTGNIRHLDVGRVYLTHSPECSCKKPSK